MIRNKTIQGFICKLLSILLISVNLNGLAVAGIVTTGDLQQSEHSLAQRDMIKEIVDRADVRDLLIEHGVSADEVMDRVNTMSDEELTSLHAKIQDMPAGQGALETILIVFVILILLDLTGVTDIFPRI